MYGFSSSVVTFPFSQNSQIAPGSASSHLNGGVLPPSVRLSFQIIDFKSFWDNLCDPRNLVLVEVLRPLPRIIKHKPSAIVFSDRKNSVQYKDLVRPDNRLYNYKSLDEVSPLRQSEDDDNSNTSGPSSGLHRQFIISRKRRNMHKARIKRRGLKKEQERLCTVRKTKQETLSSDGWIDGITYNKKEVRVSILQEQFIFLKLSFLS